MASSNAIGAMATAPAAPIIIGEGVTMMSSTDLASQPDSDKLASGRAYNITNGEPCTLRSIVQRLIDELKIDCRIRSVPYPMLDMIARSMERFGSKTAKEPALTHYGVSKLNFDFTLDISRAENELGYKPIVTLDEGIVRTAAWLRDHGKLHR